MTTFLRWLNGWRLVIAAVIIFLAYALLTIAIDLHIQSKCILWDRQPSNPDTAIAVIFVLFFLCIIAAAAGLIWGIAGLAVRMQTVVSSPDQPASRPGTRSTGRLRWLNGWRLLTGSLVTGAILFLFIGDWMIRDDYCLQWLDHTPIPLPPSGVTQTIMYATVALGLAGLIWGVVDLFIKIERRRQGRP